MSSKDENKKNAKIKKTSTNTNEDENLLLEYMEDVDDKRLNNAVMVKILTVL